MRVVQPVETANTDQLVMQTFLEAINLLGGPRKLIEHRNLTWLPSLMEACYAIILEEVQKKFSEEIAEELGLTRQTVQKILSADPEMVMRRIKGEFPAGEIKEHIAGGLAKLAYQRVKEGRGDLELVLEASQRAIEAVGGPWWAVMALTRLKGIDFPIEKPDVLKERFEGIKIDDRDLAEIVEKISYPIKTPAELLKKVVAAREE